MEKGSTGSKQTKRYSWIIGLFIFITALLLGCIIVKNIEKEKNRHNQHNIYNTTDTQHNIDTLPDIHHIL